MINMKWLSLFICGRKLYIVLILIAVGTVCRHGYILIISIAKDVMNRVALFCLVLSFWGWVGVDNVMIA